MTTKRRGILTVLVLVGYLAWLIQPADATVQYTVTDLGAVGQYIVRINEAGQVAGSMEMPDGTTQAFTWTAGHLSTLGTLVGDSNAWGLNDRGQAVGWAAAAAAGTDPRAVLWQDGIIQDLNEGTMPRITVAMAINNSGQILARSTTSTYLLDDGTWHNLGFQEGLALNEAGQAAGAKDTGQADTNGAIAHAVFWNGQSLQDLGTLGGKRSQAWDINNAGLLVGAANGPESPYGYADTACYWDALGIHQIPIVGTTSEAFAVNDIGQIVGMYGPPTDTSHGHAFIYSGGIAQDLNDLIDPASGWLLGQAWDINNAGQIVGAGLLDGQRRSFILTPVPVPGTLALFLPGLLWMRRKVHS